MAASSGGSIALRLGMNGAQQIKSELASLGPVGRDMARQIAQALEQPSTGLRVLDTGVAQLKDKAKEAAGETGGFGKTLMAIGPAGFAAAAGLGLAIAAIDRMVEAGKEAGNWAETLRKTADGLGQTTNEVQKWRQVGEQFMLTNEQVDQSLKTLMDRVGAIQSGVRDKRIQPFLDEMGLTRESFATVHSAGDAIELLAGHIDRLDSAAKKVQLAKAFGLDDWIPILERGKEGVRGLGDEAQRSGTILGDEFVQKTADANQKLREAEDRLEKASLKLSGQFTPALAGAEEKLASLVGWFDKLTAKLDVLPSIAGVASAGLAQLFPLALPFLGGGRWPDVSGARFQSPDRSFTVDKSVGIGQDAADRTAADKARREAERLAKEAEERKRTSLEAVDTATVEELNARKALTADVQQEAALQAQIIDAAARKKVDQLNEELAQHKITQAAHDTAAALVERARVEQQSLLDRETAAKLEHQWVADQQAIVDAYQEIASISASMATTLDERRQIEQKSLKLRQAQEDAALRADLDARLAKGEISQSYYDSRIGTQDDLFAAQQKQLNFNLMGPGQRFQFDLSQSMDMAGQKAEVSILQSLNDELVQATSGAETLGDAFSHMGQRIEAALANIAIQEMIIKPLAGLLFGGAGGAGGGGFLSSFFSKLLPGLFGSSGATSTSSFDFGGVFSAGYSADAYSGLANNLPGGTIDIGANAGGTPSWKGGPTRMNERGFEVYDLPDGTRVYPHEASVALVQAAARGKSQNDNVALAAAVGAAVAGGSGGGGSVTVNNYGNERLQPKVSSGPGGTIVDLYPSAQSAVRGMGQDGSLYQALKNTPPPVKVRG